MRCEVEWRIRSRACRCSLKLANWTLILPSCRCLVSCLLYVEIATPRTHSARINDLPSLCKSPHSRAQHLARQPVGNSLQGWVIGGAHALGHGRNELTHSGFAPKPRVQVGFGRLGALRHACFIVEGFEIVHAIADKLRLGYIG